MSLALRVLSALVVWLAATGHVSGLAHFALVSHHVCATHGELAHGEEHAHEPAVAPSAEGARSFTTAGEADEEHDHCSLLARQKELAATGDGATAALAPAAPAPTVPHLDVPPHRGEAVLAFAPKTSPPA